MIKRKVILALFFAAAMELTACSGQQEERIMEITEGSLNAAQMTEVIRGDLQITLVYDALVEPKVEQLTFPEDGIFGEYKVAIGDEVKAGDVLAVPDTENVGEAIEEKQQELETLTVNFNYQKETLNNQIEILKLRMDDVYGQIEKSEYMSPEFTALCIQVGNYDEEKKRIELQLQQLQETYDLEYPHCERQLQKLKDKYNGNVIRAPFDGVIVALMQEPEDTIHTNLYYVAIADPDILYARCDYVSESVMEFTNEAVFWKDGIEYPVSYIPMEERKYRVMMNYQETFYSEFEIENTEEIVTGDYGKIKLIVNEKENILLLPENAVQTDGDGAFVYRDCDGEKERVVVKTGSKNGLFVEIMEGLQEGDRIYVQK